MRNRWGSKNHISLIVISLIFEGLEVERNNGRETTSRMDVNYQLLSVWRSGKCERELCLDVCATLMAKQNEKERWKRE